MNTKPDKGTTKRGQRLRAIRLQMACIARAAAAHVFTDWHPYACVSLGGVIAHGAAWRTWRGLMVAVLGLHFRPKRRRAVWWRHNDSSTRALALLFLQRVIERASLDEVEMWVRTYAPDLLVSESQGLPVSLSGKGVAR